MKGMVLVNDPSLSPVPGTFIFPSWPVQSNSEVLLRNSHFRDNLLAVWDTKQLGPVI